MNQHYEFWVRYYEKLKESDNKFSRAIPDNNERLTGHEWGRGTIEIRPSGEQRILLQVGYPGLLVGLGNSHGSGRAVAIDDEVPPEIKLGITLDTVTGLPYLPGSTVKGALRSAFLSNRDYVRILLEENGTALGGEQVEELELDIFGHQHAYHKYETRDEVGGGGDMFLDAWPVKPDANAHLLGIESITPHRADKIELDGLSEPNPLTLLKVMPGVVFLFRFLLADSKLSGEITVTAQQKRLLFRQLLLDLGMGAKTNVGFGVLVEPTGWTDQEKYYYPEQLDITSRRPDSNAFRLTSVDQIEAGMVVVGKLVIKKDFGWFVELVPPPGGKRRGTNGLLHSSKIPDDMVLTRGQEVLVKILSDTMGDKGRRISLEILMEGEE